MGESWLDFCLRRPGPTAKQGYAGRPSRTLGEIAGEVKHSMEGSLAAALGELDKPERRASWTFSVPLVGPPLQHYPLEAITWHAGSLMANAMFVGVEHEGKAGEPLTENQVHWTTEISRALRKLCPKIAADPPGRQVNLWEHNEMTRFGSAPTACPSGRIPWDEIISRLREKEEDEMALPLIRIGDGPKVYLAVGGLLVHIPSPEVFSEMGFRWEDVRSVPETHVLAQLPRLEVSR